MRRITGTVRKLGKRHGGLWLSLVVAAAMAAGCAHKPPQMGVPIDQRPTPKQPPPDSAVTGKSTGATPAETPPPTASQGGTMGAEDRQATIARIVADTTAASAAVKKCAAAKELLPDQESVFETTRGYLMQARAALKRDELWEAESLARRARQLSLSLECH